MTPVPIAGVSFFRAIRLSDSPESVSGIQTQNMVSEVIFQRANSFRIIWPMRITTPKHRATLWVIANLLLLAAVPVLALHLGRQLPAGAFPDNADSIGLPIVGLAVWVSCSCASAKYCLVVPATRIPGSGRPVVPGEPDHDRWNV